MISYDFYTTVKSEYLNSINTNRVASLNKRTVNILAFDCGFSNESILNVTMLGYIDEVNQNKRPDDDLTIPAWTDEFDLSMFLSKLKNLS